MTVPGFWPGPSGSGSAAGSGPFAKFKRTGAIAETFRRNGAQWANISNALTSGAELIMGIGESVAGQTISRVGFLSGTTAMVTPSNVWFTLRDSTYTLRGITADEGSGSSWAANSDKELILATPYVIPDDGIYYIGVMVRAATVPTLTGTTAVSGLGLRAATALPLVAAMTSATTYTDPTSAATTLSGFANVNGQPYGWVR